jgi:hypothetical protein
MNCFSSFVIPFISEGLFLNHKKNIMTQINPKHPFMKKVVRHPNAIATGITISGARAEPVFKPTIIDESPLDVSAAGNQREITPQPFGKAPASLAPKRNRTNTKEMSPVANPVKAVKIDHDITIRISVAR